MIPWLPEEPIFPALAKALVEPNGLLAAGGDLSPQRLLATYRRGIFPWFSVGEPILWWSPDPRMVLFPGELKVSRSLARTLRNANYEVRLDTAFGDVIRACAGKPREGQPGTWITHEMQQAYRELHRLGYAHSVETWVNGRLVGGLYCVNLGGMVFGESMFAHQTDASKMALAALVAFCSAKGLPLIDCQQNTRHLASLGAAEISRAEFVAEVATLVAQASPRWEFDALYWQQLLTARPQNDLTT